MWNPYLDVCRVGEELQACCLSTGNIALNTDLAKDKCTLGPESECLGEYQDEFLGKHSGEQHNLFSPRPQWVHKTSTGNPEVRLLAINNSILSTSGRLQTHQTTTLQDRCSLMSTPRAHNLSSATLALPFPSSIPQTIRF